VCGHPLRIFNGAAGIKISVMPVALNVWQPTFIRMPISPAQHWTMSQASIRFIDVAVSLPVRPTADRKGALPLFSILPEIKNKVLANRQR
jgi:hypothetical protein